MKHNIYDSIAAKYDTDSFNILKHAHDAAIFQIKNHLQQADSILDLGMGTGNFIIALSKFIKFNQFTGVDLSSKMIARAQAKITFPWTAIVDSAQNINQYVAPLSQDLIIMQFLYDFVPPEQLLKICYQLLKPGGWLSIASTHKQQYQDKVFIAEYNKHAYLYDKLKIRDAINQSKTLGSHSLHLDLIQQQGFTIVAENTLIEPILLKDAKQLWALFYDSGWMASYFSQFSTLSKTAIKGIAYLLQLPIFHTYPMKLNCHLSIVLAQKKIVN